MTRRERRVVAGQATAATYNMGDGADLAKIHDLRRLQAWGASLIGCQEGGDRGHAIRTFRTKGKARGGRWREYAPRGIAGAASVPLLWDDEVWKRERVRTVMAVARTWVGPRGAGPTFAKTKDVNVAVLRHRATGRRVKALVSHPIPSVTRKHLGAAETRARHDHYARHIGVVARIVKHSRIPVILFIDAQAEASFPLLEPLARAGLVGWTTRGTHGRRAIDHVLTKGLVASHTWVRNTSSDHDAVVKSFRWTRS